MKSAVWKEALQACADPERARHHLDLLAATSAAAQLQKASREQARILCALFSGSVALTNWLATHPDALASLTPDLLRHPRREQGLRQEVDGWFKPLLAARDYEAAFSRLREFKQRELLRIAARDLAGLAGVTEITRELSAVADVCLSAVCQACRQRLGERLGNPFHQDAEGRWQPTGFCVLGLGKLGGQELNYSSDVDVIFVYAEEGQVFKQSPGKGKARPASISNHQYFVRLAEAFIAEVSRMTGEGMLYRIDLRLRPEGDAGPLARSLDSYESYYAQWGQTWERMMLIKAGCVAGDAALAADFLETIQNFRYPRSLSEGVLREVGAMKDRIETEVVKLGELDRNVKLGRGGIREIEFIAQSLQLLHGGRLPFVQGAQTLPALEKLAQYELLLRADASTLTEAYNFLRAVEHRLQMEENQQTHTIPVSHAAQTRLAALMGLASLKKFESARSAHTRSVQRIFDKLLRADAPARSETLPPVCDSTEAQWREILRQHSFKDVDQALRRVREFVHGPGYVHVSNRTVALAMELLPKLLALCPKTVAPDRAHPHTASDDRDKGTLTPHPNPVASQARHEMVSRQETRASRAVVPIEGRGSRKSTTVTILSDPDRVLTRLDSYISAYGTRMALFETWARNPPLFTLLLMLFDRSEFLAEVAIRNPDLVDGLVLSGRLRQRKTPAGTLADLRHGRDDADQRLWLRRYHQAELMRIGLRDILGLADFEQNLAELSALADACLQYALEVVTRKHRFKTAPFAIIGLGKLGGAEINYGSDLDIVFVTEAKPKELPKLQSLAADIMELLSSRTESGAAFVTDARLRPDGEKGLLVNTLEAYENYYRQRAQLWEIQSLSRSQPVAGDPELGHRFQALAATLTDFRPENVAAGFTVPGFRSHYKENRKTGNGQNVENSGATGLAAYSPDWKDKIRRMRERIEKERTPPGQDALAIKTGAGGLMDAEFIAQTLCLAYGWHEPNTLGALFRAGDSGKLPAADARRLIENYRQLRRVEGILRRWSFEGETVLPVEDAPFARVAVRCGFNTPEQFQRALKQMRQAIRSVYDKTFGTQAMESDSK